MSQIKATFGMKAINTEVTAGEKHSLEENFGGHHEIYSNHSSKIIDTVYIDKSQIETSQLGNIHKNSKIQPANTVNDKLACYI